MTDKSNNFKNSDPSDSAALRAFIAFMLPLDLSARIDKKVRRFDAVRAESEVRWVSPQNLHLTLRFLGSCSLQQLESVGEELTRRLSGLIPFICISGGLDFLPNHNHPRVMALKIHACHRMNELHRICEEIAVEYGCQQERHRFRPHVTLARAKGFEVGQMVLTADQPDTIPVFERLPDYQMHVDEVALVVSERHQERSLYRVLRNIPLQGHL